MKKNGFTLVELLAVMVILGLLIVIAIPAYLNVYSGVKRNDLNSKLKEIEMASLKYGEKVKDEIKDTGATCKSITVEELIKKGYLVSDSDTKEVIYNPTDNAELDGTIKLCYSLKEYDIVSFYTTPFKENLVYHKGDYVTYNNKIYRCLEDYQAKGGILAKVTVKTGIRKEDVVEKDCFEEVSF